MLSHGLLNSASTIVRVGLGVVAVPIMVRSLGLEAYGVWALALAIVGVVGIGESALTTTATVQWAASPDERAALISRTIIQSQLILLVGSTALLSGVAAVMQRSQAFHGGEVIFLLSPVAGAIALQRVAIAGLQTKELYARASTILVATQAATTVAMLAAATATRDVRSVAGAYAGCQIIAAVVCLRSLRGYFPLTAAPQPGDLDRLRDYGRHVGHVTISALGPSLFNYVDKIIVGLTLGVAAAGAYSAIANIASQIALLSSTAVQPALPALARALGDHDVDEAKRTFGNASAIVSTVALSMGGVFVMFSREALGVIHLPLTAAPAARIMFVAYALYALNAPAYYLLHAARQIRPISTIAGVASAASLALIAAAGWTFGLVGSAAGNLAYSATLLLYRPAVKHLRISLLDAVRPAFLPLVVGSLLVVSALIPSLLVRSTLGMLGCTVAAVRLVKVRPRNL